MKISQKLPRHESNSGQICGGCGHAVSNHYVIVDTEYPNNTMLDKCTICKSRKCEW